MLVLVPLAGLVVVGSLVVYTLRQALADAAAADAAPPPTLDVRCALDAHTPTEAVAFVRRMSGGDTPTTIATDELSVRLVRHYRRFPPSEASLQRMSLAQQRLCGTGCQAEFAVCTLLAAMMVAIQEEAEEAARAHTPPPSIGRTAEVAMARRSSDGLYSATAPVSRSAPGSKSM